MNTGSPSNWEIFIALFPSAVTLILGIIAYIELRTRFGQNIKKEQLDASIKESNTKLTADIDEKGLRVQAEIEDSRKKLDASIRAQERSDELVKEVFKTSNESNLRMAALSDQIAAMLVARQEDLARETERKLEHERTYQAQERIIREQQGVNDENAKSVRAVTRAFDLLNISVDTYQRDMKALTGRWDIETLPTIFERLQAIAAALSEVSTKLFVSNKQHEDFNRLLSQASANVVRMESTIVALYPKNGGRDEGASG